MEKNEAFTTGTRLLLSILQKIYQQNVLAL